MRPTYLTPVLLLAIVACSGKDKKGGPIPPPQLTPVEYPDAWQARESAIAMRITNSSPNASNTVRSLNRILNNRLDIENLMMRGGVPTNAAGEPQPVDANKPLDQRLSGSAVEQVQAVNAAFASDGALPAAGGAFDDCGNEMIAAFVTPDMLQYALAGEAVAERPEWSAGCGTDADCNTAKVGLISAAFGELRPDGLLDMTVTINPIIKPVRSPAAWGHWIGYFLSENNPGFPIAPIVLNASRIQLNMFGLWEAERLYADEYGVREVYKFPHLAREITKQDVIVAFEGSLGCEKYYNAQGYGGDKLPFGCATNNAVTFDRNSEAGEFAYNVYSAVGVDESMLLAVQDAMAYQIGANLSCPSAADPAWIKDGPVEIFVCPDGPLSDCLGFHDMEQGACDWMFEGAQPTPFAQPVSFTEIELLTPQTPVFLAPQRHPYSIERAPEFTGGSTGRIQLTVAANTVLYVQQPTRLTRLDNIANPSNPIEVPLPETKANTHCDILPVKRIDLGAEVPAGNYTLTVDVNGGPLWMMVTTQSIFAF